MVNNIILLPITAKHILLCAALQRYCTELQQLTNWSEQMALFNFLNSYSQNYKKSVKQ